MDFSKYMKNQPKYSSRANVGPYGRKKYCLTCGREVEKTDSHLYYQSFCSDACKDEYMQGEAKTRF
ncbi:MAG: hypothetical protein HY393_01855 [Candidatus Diapherotrites archaeon]|nr:hypothetical protein [Candidatus Diapherotrites archaeon]